MAYSHRLIGSCFTLLAAGSFALCAGAYVVKSPSSHDTAYGGDEIKIKWKSEKKKGDTVFIELFKGETLVNSLGGFPDKESAKWTVPVTLAPSNAYRIKISNNAQKDLAAYSDNFTVQSPVLKIIKPNSGTIWRIDYSGASGPIRWEKKGLNGTPLKIELFRHSRLIFTKSTSQSDYSIDLSNKSDWWPSTGYRIKLTSANDSTVSCLSDEFAIQNANTPSSLAGVDLDWRPTEGTSMGAGATSLQNVVFAMGVFTDARKDTALIGMNKERAKPRLVTTGESVSLWCCQSLKKVFQDHKINFDSVHYDAVLSGVVQEFQVLETGTYNAAITVKFKVLSKTGDSLWEQEIKGGASNWGKSYKLENYYECLSNAYVQTIRNLLADDSFQNAVRKIKN